MSLIRFSPKDLSSSSCPAHSEQSSQSFHRARQLSREMQFSGLLYAKCIQYLVWKLPVWNSAHHLVLCLRFLCPHGLPSTSGWTLFFFSLSSLVCFFLLFFSSLSVQLQPCLLCFFFLVHPPCGEQWSPQLVSICGE